MRTIDRRAYLALIRNVRRGLRTRSQILDIVESQGGGTTAEIAKNVDVTYSTTLYHLRNMQREGLVRRDPDTREWRPGAIRQVRLTEFLKRRRRSRRVSA